uniref:CCHC-type domain-containing protein n=1 Tax=Trichogramma kaykai TaxID=54128 RepID=A0ABD2W640_9HYME
MAEFKTMLKDQATTAKLVENFETNTKKLGEVYRHASAAIIDDFDIAAEAHSPKFGGRQSEWDSFKSLFTSMVKDSPSQSSTGIDGFSALSYSILDNQTREPWEQYLPADAVPPSYDKLIKFLENRVQALDTANCPDPDNSQRQTKTSKEVTQRSKSASVYHTSGSDPPTRRSTKCSLCAMEHRLGSCPEFNALTLDQRWKYTRDHNLCFNCFSESHKGSDCPFALNCRMCKQAHHTKLHRNQAKPEDSSSTRHK